MEEYPEELRTPPVALVCAVGCPEVHGLITAHLHSQQPPINTIALPDFSKISVIPSKKPHRDNSEPVGGILKRDWLSKHRTRIPAVVAALFSSHDVSGDPAQWLQVCNDLENLKATIRGRNIKLVVVVVSQAGHKDDTSEDRMIALRKRAEVDLKNLIIFVPDDQLELKQSLSRLGTAFADLANAYYRDEGRRVKVRLEKKSFSSMELNVRYCFKVAIYAEFRRDWLEALKFYEDSYHALREMVGTSTRMPPIQRLVEIKTVAEQLHFKMSTLLLHGGKVAEAIAWFRQHTANYRKLVGAPEVIFLHWEWLSRQYLVFAQLLETSSVNVLHVPTMVSVPAEKPTEWEFHPAYYYQLAASYLKEKNICLEFALSMSEDVSPIDGSAESVVASVYLGQFARLLEHGDTYIMQFLSDDEYVRYTLAEGKRFQDSFEIIALLKRSFEAYNNLKAERTAAYCGFQMAREYFSVSEFSNAKQIFDNVANLYRREGWLLSLWEVLGYLRECSRGLSSAKDFMEYSLEMAALPVTDAIEPSSKDCGPAGPATLLQRAKIHNETFEVAMGKSELNCKEQNCHVKVNSDYPLYLEIDLVSPLRVVLLALVAFHQPMVKPGAPSQITISLRSQLPTNVEIDQLEVQFNQSECNFIIGNGQKPHLAAISNVQLGRRVETAPALVLATNKWLRLTYEIKSDQSGKLECIYVIARIGPHFTICCRAESPASMNDLPLWKFENLLETIPTKDPGLAFSGQKAIQVEEPEPQVDLILGSSGPALVGESFILPVTVASKGHAVYSGELKINLVDTRGGGLLSPREDEPLSADNLHVELVDISCHAPKDQSKSPPDKIQKIQPSFGLVSVPSLDVGDSWSCKLQIKWNRPKPIMLYVSLGYHPQSGETSSQKVHVHKSLQIEGRTAVTISHRYMLPFRQDPLLLSKFKSVSESDQIPSLALNELTMLIISAKNCSEVPLRLLSMSIEAEENNGVCTVQPQHEDFGEPVVHVPGEEFKKVFTVVPKTKGTKLKIGTVSLRWQRDSRAEEQFDSCATASQVAKHRLPDVNVELPPLVVSLECPPYAILGNPFIYSVKIRNQTEWLQEIKYSMADSQSFVSAGPYSDTIFVLPRSTHALRYMLVPLGLGSQQLPKVTLTSARYSAGLQPPTASSIIFVFPWKPHFEASDI
ncbi:hypothetical protein CDL12_08701 [Handroanthus impetiginosus]|uniref:Trafficking protein particle complex subunit 11 domain-containing protein n=1 Tax=Handroanthus impetiginosus TaxID=429701 RepID=A0A2G9HM74_9LAMI|nr:hypothetical protein CDL12_08701 [Handroanthus impetiginosus]